METHLTVLPRASTNSFKAAKLPAVAEDEAARAPAASVSTEQDKRMQEAWATIDALDNTNFLGSAKWVALSSAALHDVEFNNASTLRVFPTQET